MFIYFFDFLETFDPENNYLGDFQHSITCNKLSVQEFTETLKNENNCMLNIVNYNVRSFSANAQFFLPLIENSRPEIFIATETWFTDDYQAEINDYDSFHTVRLDRQSGGVSIYVSNSINSRKIVNYSYSNADIEICTTEINIGNELIYIFGIYRPHSGTVDSFIHEFDRIIQDPMFNNKRCCIAGDLNINLLSEANEVKRFIEFLQSYHYFPVITKPTRYPPDDNHSPTLIDHIWLNSLNIINSGVVHLDLLDHIPTYVQLPLPISSKNDEYVSISFRINSEENRQIFRNTISEFDWTTCISNDVNEYLHNFTDKLDSLYCSIFPLKSKMISKRKALNPWFSSELNDLINQKSVYFELYRQGIVTKQENNLFKNKVKVSINKAKHAYYKKVLDDSFGNIRLTWKTLNNLMGRANKKSIKSIITDSGEIYDEFDMAETFNRYFANVPLELDTNVPDSNIDPTSFIHINLNSTITEFEPCTPDEVSTILSDLNLSKVDINSIPNKLIVQNKDIFSPVLCDIVNGSFLSGAFPDSLKIGKIVPIHKKGCNRTPANYRPVTISPFLGKVFEKIMYVRLIDHINDNNILSAHQFGFRKNMSTVDAIMQLTEFIYDTLDNKNSCVNVLIDYSRAFDTVNHRILLDKLNKYGVREKALQLLASYLENRKQCVRINNTYSNLITTNISIPQGSVLGPLLFILFINCLPNISQNFLPTMFADDCTLSFRNNNLDNLVSVCNEELMLFKLWSDANRLTINVDKTNCLFFSNIFDPPCGRICIDDQEIDFVSETKFLGMFIDDKVKFDKHINYICNKISISNGIMFRIRKLVPTSCLKSIYYSIIHQYILYCLPIFGATYNCHLELLFLAQKRAVRTISRAEYNAHTDPLFFSNKILKLNDLYKHCIASYVYSNQHLLDVHVNNHNYFTRNNNYLQAPRVRLRSCEQSIIYNAVNIWNEVPDDIKACLTKASFKYNYKNYLLNQYNN